jgi:two-component system sensor histidine kinase BaeS
MRSVAHFLYASVQVFPAIAPACQTRRWGYTILAHFQVFQSMRLKLAHKLFLINAGIIFALTAVFVSLSYFISKSMYSNALNGIDLDVMESLSENLSEQYKKSGTWDIYVNDRTHWNQTVDNNFFAVFFSLMAKVAENAGRDNPPASGPPIPPPAAANPKWEFPFGTFFQRLSLLDPDKKPLIEPEIFNADASYQKIKLDGKVIGWLRVGRINVDMLPLAQYFFEQQLNIVYWSSVVGGIIAVALSFLLSRHITAPIRILTLGARQIAKRNFQSLIRINTRDELQELAESFNAISKELELHQTRQKQWLMDVSHELKAPLTLLVGEVFAICDNLSKCDDATATFLQNEVQHIKRMADDLYQLCQMDEQGFNLNRQTIELQPFMEYQVRRYLDKFRSTQIKLHENYAPEPIYLNVDCDRLSQVLSNIFENCLRYMDSPGELWVRLAQAGGKTIVEVEDSGPGVPEGSLSKLFDRHYSVDAAGRRASGGAGLGLAICKEIIAAHDGEISAISGSKGGLCIRILLPLQSGVHA